MSAEFRITFLTFTIFNITPQQKSVTINIKPEFFFYQKAEKTGYINVSFLITEMPSYHYPGRMGNRGYGNVKHSASMFQPQQPQAVLASGTSTLHSHRPAMFRTGWE